MPTTLLSYSSSFRTGSSLVPTYLHTLLRSFDILLYWARWHAHHTPLTFLFNTDWLRFDRDTSTLGTLACSSHSFPPSLLFRVGHVGMLIDIPSASHPVSSYWSPDVSPFFCRSVVLSFIPPYCTCWSVYISRGAQHIVISSGFLLTLYN